MRAYNYASYARTFEKGLVSSNMTKVARLLFEPIITTDWLVNRDHNPYTIEPGFARQLYRQEIDIPENIKKAVGDQGVVSRTNIYFSKTVLGQLNALTEDAMLSEMVRLIRNSDLDDVIKEELLEYYENDQIGTFLAMAFLHSLTRNNTATIPDKMDDVIDDDIKKFQSLIKKYPKPEAIDPPEEIKKHELGYVSELYKVYSEKAGHVYNNPEDLKSNKPLLEHFNRQRKDYYKAETIRRELRDTFRLDEGNGFNIFKDEIYDGVIDTCDLEYNTGFDRMTAVLLRAPIVPLSNNLKIRMLEWVSSGEKKGVCHMLVNDNRLKWMKDDDSE